VRTKTENEIFELMDILKKSGIGELHLEMPGFKFHGIKDSQGEPSRPVEISSGASPSWNELRTIIAPRLGIFRQAEKPGAPFLAGPGQKVGETNVVGFIQVLEKAYPVFSGVRGIIERICAEDGKMVEFNQPLFLVVDNREKD
jgi:biotin carboxyl carrier protein